MMVVEAYAKLNLSLRVLGRRDDGYHEIDSLVQTIDLADRLHVEHGDAGLRVVNSLGIPEESDLAFRAATAVARHKGVPVDLEIRVIKGIPAGAGLGGGSSDGAAALWIADQATPPYLDDAARVDLASRIGADVNLFLIGGALRMRGLGERISAVWQSEIEAYVLLIPPIACDTGVVYRAWSEHRRRAPWRDDLEVGRNDLLEPALACYPSLRAYHEASLVADGEYAGMSGSGATFYVACRSRAHADETRERFAREFPEAMVRVVSPTASGHRVIRTEGGRMKIAIDGPAASGKSSVGRALAERLGCRFVETGKMYRAVALAFARGLSLAEIGIEVDPSGHLLLNGEDVSAVLHTPELDQGSSRVAVIPEVREHLVNLQRRIAEQSDVVMEGRDIGTVVLPDADVKIFLRASARERARRRVREREGMDFDTILSEIEERDHRDSHRTIAPLNAATDAHIIETDRKALFEVISEVTDVVKGRLAKR